MTELDADGKQVAYPVKPGETGKTVLGVTNLTDEPLDGAVVHVHVLNDMDLPRVYTNCQYYVDSNLDGAWCEIDRKLVKGETFATDFAVAAAPDARPDNWSRVIARWFPKSYADENGGITELARRHSGRGTTPEPGTRGQLTLTPKPLPIPAEPSWISFTDLKLTVTLLAALNAHDGPYPISRGETTGLNLGVANVGTAPADGVVLRVRAYDDLDLPRLAGNCQYYTDVTVDGALCEFPQQLPADRTTYAVNQLKVAAAADAEARTTKSVQVEWFPKEWMDRQGGITEFIKKSTTPGTAIAPGTGPALTLTPAEMVVPEQWSRAITVTTTLVAAPTSAPGSPSVSPSDGATAAPADPANGGLANTGSATTTVVAVGGALLLAGVLGLLAARRRRTRFTA